MFVSKDDSIVNLSHVSAIMLNRDKIEFYGEPQNEEADLDDLPLIESYIYKTEEQAIEAYEKIKAFTRTLDI